MTEIFKTKRSKYKPLLFTTTLRNPKRMRGLLNILSKFNGRMLSDQLAKEIMGEVLRYGLYRPTKQISSEVIEKWGGKRLSDRSEIGLRVLSDSEVEFILANNLQQHKERGFDWGWPSRFATEFDFAKELGFVYYWVGEKIQFSEIGLKLANSVEISLEEDNIVLSDLHPELEQQAFLNALSKLQRNNPFVRVLNENVPLILLLEVIQKINSDTDLNGTGISVLELPFIIFWKDKNSTELYEMIKEVREKYGAKPSWEVIIEICLERIMGGDFKKFNPKSIMVDYPDEFIRKMRLTGLISIRGGGRFIDINKTEQYKVEYILEHYSKYQKYSTERQYFDYMATVDNNLISLSSTPLNIEENNKQLQKWVDIYPWDKIKKELLTLSTKGLSTDELLKYLSSPTRLEFLTTLAIKSRFPTVKVIPNYPCDDEGIPTSTAGGIGNKGDIECFEEAKGVLIEVTMSEGRTQTVMEIWPISRHLAEFNKKVKNSMCYFVAPSIFTDSLKQIGYIKQEENKLIVPKSIKEFLNQLESSETLYNIN